MANSTARNATKRTETAFLNAVSGKLAKCPAKPAKKSNKKKEKPVKKAMPTKKG